MLKWLVKEKIPLPPCLVCIQDVLLTQSSGKVDEPEILLGTKFVEIKQFNELTEIFRIQVSKVTPMPVSLIRWRPIREVKSTWVILNARPWIRHDEDLMACRFDGSRLKPGDRAALLTTDL
jgi:hypothetical protein